jgi:MtN3 and saliva related transmembrane protein
MLTETIDLIGLAAGGLTTVSFVPQVLKIWRTKSGRDVSYGMFLLFSLGVLLWLVYGLMLNALPIIVANAVTLVLALGVLGLKYWYGRKAEQVGPRRTGMP